MYKMNTLLGRFSGMNTKTSTGGGSYFEPGVYLAKITGIKHKEAGFRGESYIMEFEILEVLVKRDPETRSAPNGSEVKFNGSRKAGDVVSHVLKLDGENKELALGNLADFLRACSATMSAKNGQIITLKDVEIDDDDPVNAASEEQPLAGLELEVWVQGTITQKKQQAFNNITYKVPRDLIAQAA